MKYLPVLYCLMFSFAAHADDDPKPAPLKSLQQTSPNVTIIDGKKFFSLQNARHFTGSTNSPRALSVIHHPRPEGGAVTGSHRTSLPFASPSSGTALPTTATDKEKVLSIFDPDNKSVSHAR
jgi:hypothetical protein